MIPKRFIRIWLSQKKIRKVYDKWWGWFQDIHPDWEFLTIKDEDADSYLSGEFEDLFYRQETWAARADVLRLPILYQLGGFYVDVDTMPVKSFDPLTDDWAGTLVERAVVGHESRVLLQNAIIGAPPEHPAVKLLIDELPESYRKYSYRGPATATGPRFITYHWWDRKDVRRMPPEAFYPVRRIARVEFERAVMLSPGAYAAHYGAGTWWSGYRGGTVPEPERRP